MPVLDRIKYKTFYIATTNKAKIERMFKLFRWISDDITLLPVPNPIDVEETEPTLEGNSLKKAMAYAGKYDLPVISLDSGVFIEGEGSDPVRTKRNALNGESESKFTEEQISQKVQEYYRDIARKHGGTVDFYFKDVYTILYPDGKHKQVAPIRHYTLTTIVKGPLTQFPLRSLYISKTTGKRPLEQTEKDERKELNPVIKEVKRLISI